MGQLEKFDKYVKELQNTSGRIDKENIVRKYSSDVEITYLLDFLFNPFITTGIDRKKLVKKNFPDILMSNSPFTDLMLPMNDKDNLIELLCYIKEHSTGDSITVGYVQMFIKAHENYSQLISEIVTKNLKLGIQATTINKVYGKNFIPCFDVMLANKYFDDPERLLPQDTEFILTTKLDGIRCVCVNETDGPRFFTRQGQLIEGLIELEKEFTALPLNFVYDGELLLDLNELESKDLYRRTVKVVNSDGEKRNVIFNCFDFLPIEEFKEGEGKTKATDRKLLIGSPLILGGKNTPHIKEVKVLYLGKDQSQIKYWLDKITSEGGEGVMINIANATYKCKRTNDLLKVKKFQDADVHVIGLIEGTGNNQGMLGAIKVEFKGPDNKIYTCKVGSGFTQDERIKYWNNKDLLLDKIVTINYFEVTNNQANEGYSLRFPTWQGIIRFDKNEIG